MFSMNPALRAGALHAVAAAAAFAMTAACVRAASSSTPTEVVVFFRNLVALLVLMPWFWRRGWSTLRSDRVGGHLVRALVGTAAMYCFFHALAKLNLAEALLLTYSTPIFIPFIAWAWLGERPAPSLWPAVAVGMAGLALIVRPDPNVGWSLASGVGLLSGVFAATAMVSIRRLSDTEPAARIVFWFSALSTAFTAVPLAWAWSTPSSGAWLPLIGAGLFATAGQLFLTRAYTLAPAARIGPFTYISVVFGGLLAWWLWGEVPDGLTITGIALVVACCVLALRR